MAFWDVCDRAADWFVAHPWGGRMVAVGMAMMWGVGSVAVMQDLKRPVAAQPPSVQEQLLHVTTTQAAQLDVIKIQLTAVVERLDTLHHDLEVLQARGGTPGKVRK